MGDNDSRETAKNLAIDDAVTKALKKSGTYVESFSLVRDYVLNEDKVININASVIKILPQSVEYKIIGDRLLCTARVKITLNTDVIDEAVEGSAVNARIKAKNDELHQKIKKEKIKQSKAGKFTAIKQYDFVKRESLHFNSIIGAFLPKSPYKYLGNGLYDPIKCKKIYSYNDVSVYQVQPEFEGMTMYVVSIDNGHGNEDVHKVIMIGSKKINTDVNYAGLKINNVLPQVFNMLIYNLNTLCQEYKEVNGDEMALIIYSKK